MFRLFSNGVSFHHGDQNSSCKKRMRFNSQNMTECSEDGDKSVMKFVVYCFGNSWINRSLEEKLLFVGTIEK